MPRSALCRLAAALATLCVLAPAAHAAGPEATEEKVERFARAAGGGSGAYVVDLDTGRELAAVRARKARVPASVEKLFTTSAALLRLGVDGRLSTTLLAERGTRPARTVASDVWIRGGGDPTLGPAGLRVLAAQVAAAGIRRIEGNIYADETAFDLRRGPPSEGYAASAWIAPLSALAYENGRHPAKKVAVYMRQALDKEGVRLTGRVRYGAAPRGAVTLAQLGSPTMASLARVTNVYSNNWYAELMLKALGVHAAGEGSTAAGAGAARSILSSVLGVRPVMVDGSGLSRSNRTTPRQVVKLLVKMARRDEGGALDASLAIAGRTGTLENRMRRSVARDRCRAKTGTLSDVSALAGYCTSRRGSEVAFAVLMNGVNPSSARRLQNRIASVLARYRR